MTKLNSGDVVENEGNRGIMSFLKVFKVFKLDFPNGVFTFYI